MNSLTIFLSSAICFVLAYRFYGRFLSNQFNLDDKNLTPANTCQDGCDFIPAKHPAILFGHHFSSIAGAGPIVGTIIAATTFGWGGVLAWIVIGSIFFGGVSDFSAMVLSIRNRGASISNISGSMISPKARTFFIGFVILALILVNAIFALYAAKTFYASPEIVLPSLGLIPVAMFFGWLVYEKNFGLLPVTVAALLVFAGLIAFADKMPVSASMNFWILVLLVYSFAASVLPVNMLLQPRDYLSSFLLYAGMLLGFCGIVLNPLPMQLPRFKSASIIDVWPILFITVACGAISGFHTLIASGTTSKQIAKESHSKIISYGGMLLEGALAVIALITVAIGIAPGADVKNPLDLFSKGFGRITAGITGNYGSIFAMMLLNAFILTTLDTSTRITRYLINELIGEKNRYAVTAVVLFFAGALAFSGEGEKIWPIFGASNQLVAALSLFTVTLWLLKLKKIFYYTLIPAVFMFVTTLAGLILKWREFFSDGKYFIAIIPAVLIILALFVLKESVNSVVAKSVKMTDK